MKRSLIRYWHNQCRKNKNTMKMSRILRALFSIFLLLFFLCLCVNGSDDESSCVVSDGSTSTGSSSGSSNNGDVLPRKQQQQPQEGRKTVLVTGANGFIASWIVKLLLEEDKYIVHACVRDADDEEKVKELQRLKNADRLLKLFSTGDLGSNECNSSSERGIENCFDEPMKGCHDVFHVSIAMDWNDGRHGMYDATLTGTQHLLDAVYRNRDTVRSLILTSSTTNVAGRKVPIETTEQQQQQQQQQQDKEEEGKLPTYSADTYYYDESYWVNEQDEIARGSWYSATKTAQEKLVQHWVTHETNEGNLVHDFRYASILPTRVLGTPVSSEGVTPGWVSYLLREWLLPSSTTKKGVPNETVEFVHVQDVARMHIQAMERTTKNNAVAGRYLCVDQSYHWNDVLLLLEKLYPNMPEIQWLFHPTKTTTTTAAAGSEVVVLAAPKQFNPERRISSLGFHFRYNLDAILQEMISYLKERGQLSN